MKKEETKKSTKKVTKTAKTTKKAPAVEKDEATFNQEKALMVTFVILAILVVILLVVAVTKNNTIKATEDSHITIPVLQEDTESSIRIDLTEYKTNEDSEYMFIVSNYRENQMIKKNLEYDIEVINEYDVDLELYKNDDTKNLLQHDDEVEDNKLFKDKKQEDVYKLIIKRNDKIKDGSEVIIKIES